MRLNSKLVNRKVIIAFLKMVLNGTFISRVKCRSSRPEVFCKKGVLRNFLKFTGKHLCQSLFFNKVAGLRLKNILSYRTPLVAASGNTNAFPWPHCIKRSCIFHTSFQTLHKKWSFPLRFLQYCEFGHIYWKNS